MLNLHCLSEKIRALIMKFIEQETEEYLWN